MGPISVILSDRFFASFFLWGWGPFLRFLGVDLASKLFIYFFLGGGEGGSNPSTKYRGSKWSLSSDAISTL